VLETLAWISLGLIILGGALFVGVFFCALLKEHEYLLVGLMAGGLVILVAIILIVERMK